MESGPVQRPHKRMKFYHYLIKLTQRASLETKSVLRGKKLIPMIIEIIISFIWSRTDFTLDSVVSYQRNRLLNNRNHENHWWKFITAAVINRNCPWHSSEADI